MIVNGYTIEPRANLEGANLQGAVLWGAVLQGANLKGANLWGANLKGANLWGANLQGAVLWGANLQGANLKGANLWGTVLQGANLKGAVLKGAVLKGANLKGAVLKGAVLKGANLKEAKLSPHSICPEVGGFIAWKKTLRGVIKLYIPAKAQRTSSLVGRKCRAEYVKVLKGSGTSERGGNYVQGKIYRPDSYDDDIRIECSHGVHFFMTKTEAEAY